LSIHFIKGHSSRIIVIEKSSIYFCGFLVQPRSLMINNR
jgi:hypothetical protein